MQIMNYLAPDVVALGNHEVDYGLPHLLFLEKIANFPIVNANLYIKPFEKRMMRPYHIISKAGFDILFTGILTEKTMDSIKHGRAHRHVRHPRGGGRRGRQDLRRLQERRHRPHHRAHPHRVRIRQGTRRHATPGVGRGPHHRRAQPHDPLGAGQRERHPDRPGGHRHQPDRPLRHHGGRRHQLHRGLEVAAHPHRRAHRRARSADGRVHRIVQDRGRPQVQRHHHQVRGASSPTRGAKRRPRWATSSPTPSRRPPAPTWCSWEQVRYG